MSRSPTRLTRFWMKAPAAGTHVNPDGAYSVVVAATELARSSCPGHAGFIDYPRPSTPEGALAGKGASERDELTADHAEVGVWRNEESSSRVVGEIRDEHDAMRKLEYIWCLRDSPLTWPFSHSANHSRIRGAERKDVPVRGQKHIVVMLTPDSAVEAAHNAERCSDSELAGCYCDGDLESRRGDRLRVAAMY